MYYIPSLQIDKRKKVFIESLMGQMWLNPILQIMIKKMKDRRTRLKGL